MATDRQTQFAEYDDTTWLAAGLAERIAHHLQLVDLLCAQGKNDEAAALDEKFMERLRWEMS